MTQSVLVSNLDSAKAVRRNHNLTTLDISTWGTPIETNGSVSHEGASNQVLVCTKTAPSARIFEGDSISVKGGYWYVLSCEITQHPGFSAGSAHNRDLLQVFGVTITEGSAALQGASVTGVGQYACKFKVQDDGTMTVRAGVGCDGSENNMADGALKMGSIMLEESPFEPNGPDTYVEAGTTVWTNTTSARNVAGDEGAVTSGSPVSYSYSRWSFGVSVGDSFGNDTGEFPTVVDAELQPYAALHNPSGDYDHVAGETTSQIAARLDAAIKAPTGIKPGFVILQASVNSIDGGSETSAVAFAAVESMISTCASNNIPKSNIIILNVGPWGNGGQTAGELTETTALNDLLAGLDDVTVYDMNSALEGDANPNDLSLIANGDSFDYDSGDGIHPSIGAASGSERIGQDLASIIASKWNDKAAIQFGIVSPIVRSIVN